MKEMVGSGFGPTDQKDTKRVEILLHSVELSERASHYIAVILSSPMAIELPQQESEGKKNTDKKDKLPCDPLCGLGRF